MSLTWECDDFCGFCVMDELSLGIIYFPKSKESSTKSSGLSVLVTQGPTFLELGYLWLSLY